MVNNELLDMQEMLDNAIETEHNVNKSEIWLMKNVALVVEISEFNNEIANFKYWKKNKNTNIDNIYQEFADVLHFIFSFVNSSNIDRIKFINMVGENIENPEKAFLNLNISASKIYDNGINDQELLKTYKILLGIAHYFDLEDSKIIDNYKIKNKINYKRISENY